MQHSVVVKPCYLLGELFLKANYFKVLTTAVNYSSDGCTPGKESSSTGILKKLK